MKAIAEFKELIQRKTKEQVPVQTVWAIVKKVEWEEKVMTVEVDGLEWPDVLLGLGGEFTKPKINSKCLIGIIENKEGCFLIYASEIEEKIVTTRDTVFQISGDGFLLKKENETLLSLILDILKAIKKMKFTTNAGPTIKLINALDFEALEERFKTFLKPV